jgi:hypothetical protein
LLKLTKHFHPLKLCTFFLFSGCVIGFSNSSNRVPVIYSKIYIPSATDSSIYSGNSSRLSFAVRSLLASKTDIQISNLDEARIALIIKILDRQQSIAAVDNCNNASGTPTVANGAFSCIQIHPELTGGDKTAPTSFNQPSISPSSERMSLVVDAKAIDLNSGKILWAKRYFAGNIPAIVFNEIGDNGDSRTMAYLAKTPELHGLRHQEAVDNAVQSFSNNIANDLQNALFTTLQSYN